jgi:hypothetical protein
MTAMTAVAALLAALGCTPRMHRAYQIAVVGAAQVAHTHAVLQTRAALKRDPSIVETNPFLGERPGDALLVGAGIVNTGVGGLILALPRDRGLEGDWVIDVVATVWLALATSWAINDTRLTNERWYR